MKAPPFSFLSVACDNLAKCVSLHKAQASECAQFLMGFVDIFAGPMQAYEALEKGKPIERWGRKATGLRECS